MAKYVIYNDIHLGSPIQLMSMAEFLSSLLVDIEDHNNEMVISLGDNIDLKNIKRSRVNEAKGWIGQLKALNARSPKFHFISGNHCLLPLDDCPSVTIDNIYFTHGDLEFWGEEKAAKYRSKQAGAGFLKRKIVVKIIETFEHLISSRISKKFKENALRVAKINGCKTYVCGHKHPSKVIDFVYNEIRIIVLPRGRNEVEL